jgi:hypothetical protein
VGRLRVHVALAGDLERALRQQMDAAGSCLLLELPELELLLSRFVLLHGNDEHARLPLGLMLLARSLTNRVVPAAL